MPVVAVVEPRGVRLHHQLEGERVQHPVSAVEPRRYCCHAPPRPFPAACPRRDPDGGDVGPLLAGGRGVRRWTRRAAPWTGAPAPRGLEADGEEPAPAEPPEGGRGGGDEAARPRGPRDLRTEEGKEEEKSEDGIIADADAPPRPTGHEAPVAQCAGPPAAADAVSVPPHPSLMIPMGGPGLRSESRQRIK